MEELPPEWLLSRRWEGEGDSQCSRGAINILNFRPCYRGNISSPLLRFFFPSVPHLFAMSQPTVHLSTIILSPLLRIFLYSSPYSSCLLFVVSVCLSACLSLCLSVSTSLLYLPQFSLPHFFHFMPEMPVVPRAVAPGLGEAVAVIQCWLWAQRTRGMPLIH